MDPIPGFGEDNLVKTKPMKAFYTPGHRDLFQEGVWL
jgi:hypothetical protein